MKIDINRIPPEGAILEEKFVASALDLETEIVKFDGPLNIKARASIITNAVTVDISLEAPLKMICSRCLQDFASVYQKKFQLNYSAVKSEPVIDLDPDIRQEIILDYPLKPLCRPDCKGLCLKCGSNLNEKACGC